MILFLADGKQIRGDLIKSAALRYDLAPIPVTLEAEIRAGDDDMEKRLAEGQLVSVGTGDSLRIVKSVRAVGRAAQGEREMTAGWAALHAPSLTFPIQCLARDAETPAGFRFIALASRQHGKDVALFHGL